MNQELMRKVAQKEVLAVLTDEAGNVLWQSATSPVAALYGAHFQNTLPQGGYALYANQFGAAMSIFARRFGVKECYGHKVSQYGLRELDGSGVALIWDERIDKVHSSKDDTKVCPIEAFLSENTDETRQWEFLQERFAGPEPAEGCSCSIAAHKS